MKIDITMWDDKRRMRERIRNLATMIMSITAVNIFTLASYEAWFILGINVLFFLTEIPLFMSWAKYSKEPPKED